MIKDYQFAGYEYMDRGLWKDDNEKANLDYFYDLPLIDLSKGLGLYDEPMDTQVKVKVCKLSGLLPTECCPEQVEEWFTIGYEPFETCHIHYKTDVIVCDISKKLPNPWCKNITGISVCYNKRPMETCSICQPPCGYWLRRWNFKRWFKCIIKNIRKIIKRR